MTKQPSQDKINWRSRIVGLGKIRADQVAKHPNNPRTHPQKQRDAVAASFDVLGQIAPIVINKRNGYLVDGEERTWLALSQGDDTELDVIYVDLDEEEHNLALVTFDWITQYAQYDRNNLDALLQTINTDDEALKSVIEELSTMTGLTDQTESPPDFPSFDDDIETEYCCPKCGYKWSGKPNAG